jgi:rapamycin-insensitive companion of mTOR
MITVNASLFPSSVTNSLIAVGNDGLQERDRMVRACIAIICELGQKLSNKSIVFYKEYIIYPNAFNAQIL